MALLVLTRITKVLGHELSGKRQINDLLAFPYGNTLQNRFGRNKKVCRNYSFCNKMDSRKSAPDIASAKQECYIINIIIYNGGVKL